ncbi:RNase P subunit p30 family protein [Methanoregula sp.]|uniref:RNase P subunit p30 family protein n=1 Tax=Methanoregula sp. TaxID=2052170 RepID=UPI002C564E90|nr:RNase P subunit p30 family protein [Methanoregula sp.]HVP95571.1 RNase P subunit p30 family protein [Methanoregula sp.]
MKITDASVFPYPAGDSSVSRLALEARSLGYDSIVADRVPATTIWDIEVIPGIVLTGMPAKEVQNRAGKNRGTGSVLSVQMGDNGFNRAVAGTPGVHILRGIGTADKRAFDHVAAKIAADNVTAIDIDLSPVIFGRGHPRQKAIHRYRDLLVLCRRFEFPLTISSSARSVLCLRSVREVAGLCSLFGMDETDVRAALGGVERITGSGEDTVKVIP